MINEFAFVTPTADGFAAYERGLAADDAAEYFFCVHVSSDPTQVPIRTAIIYFNYSVLLLHCCCCRSISRSGDVLYLLLSLLVVIQAHAVFLLITRLLVAAVGQERCIYYSVCCAERDGLWLSLDTHLRVRRAGEQNEGGARADHQPPEHGISGAACPSPSYYSSLCFRLLLNDLLLLR